MREELELKFTVPQDAVAALPKRLFNGGAKARKAPTRKKLHRIYYDTPDLDLRRRGVALRVRDVGGRRVQTVKCNGAGAGPAGRMECEREIDGDAPISPVSMKRGCSSCSRTSMRRRACSRCSQPTSTARPGNSITAVPRSNARSMSARSAPAANISRSASWSWS
jgi:hypothetical protein